MANTNYELIKHVYETYMNIKPKKPETEYTPILQNDRNHGTVGGTASK